MHGGRYIELLDLRLDRAVLSHFTHVLTCPRRIGHVNRLRNLRSHLSPEPCSTATCQEYWNQRRPTLESRMSPCSYLVHKNFDIQALNTTCCLALVALPSNESLQSPEWSVRCAFPRSFDSQALNTICCLGLVAHQSNESLQASEHCSVRSPC